MKTTWGLGDYPAMAEKLMPAAKVLIDLIDPRPRERIVDLGCGTGNAAILAAQRGAQVVGVDIEPALLAIAAERAAASDLDILWVEADAASPGFPEAAFSVVMSVFGMMYLPDQQRAAHVMTSLCRPGGIIALTAWAPGSFLPAMGRTLAPYLPPPPPGAYPPARWGDDRALSEMFDAEGIYTVHNRRRTLRLVFDDTQSARDFFIETAGHVLAERPRMLQEGKWNDLLADLAALVRERNSSWSLDTVLDLEYLVSVAQKPA